MTIVKNYKYSILPSEELQLVRSLLQDLEIFKDHFENIAVNIDVSSLEFSGILRKYINYLKSTKNTELNCFYNNKSEILNYMEDFIRVMDVSKQILNSMIGVIEQQLTIKQNLCG